MSRSERSAEPPVFAAAELIALAREDFEIFVELMFPALHGGERLKRAPYIDYVCAVWNESPPARDLQHASRVHEVFADFGLVCRLAARGEPSAAIYMRQLWR